jgi:Outer membrane protein beta-barrel domain
VRPARLTPLALAAVLAAASAPRVAHAQGDPTSRPIRFGIGGGVSMPVGDFKNGGDAAAIKRDFKQGVAGQGYVEFRAPGTPLGFRAAVSYNRFDAGKVQFSRIGTGGGTSTTTTESEGYSQILGALGNVTLQLPTGPIRPYVLAGVGAFQLKNTANLAVTPAGSLTAAPEQSTTNFGVNGGAGLLLKLGPVEAFAEARLSNVYTKAEKFANLKSVQYVPITFGLSF